MRARGAGRSPYPMVRARPRPGSKVPLGTTPSGKRSTRSRRTATAPPHRLVPRAARVAQQGARRSSSRHWSSSPRMRGKGSAVNTRDVLGKASPYHRPRLSWRTKMKMTNMLPTAPRPSVERTPFFRIRLGVAAMSRSSAPLDYSVNHRYRGRRPLAAYHDRRLPSSEYPGTEISVAPCSSMASELLDQPSVLPGLAFHGGRATNYPFVCRSSPASSSVPLRPYKYLVMTSAGTLPGAMTAR